MAASTFSEKLILFWCVRCLIIDLAQAEGPVPGVLCDFPDGRPPISETGHLCRHQAHQGKATTRLGLLGVEYQPFGGLEKTITTFRTIKNRILILKNSALHMIKNYGFYKHLMKIFFRGRG